MKPINNQIYILGLQWAAEYQVKALFATTKILKKAYLDKSKKFQKIAFDSLTPEEKEILEANAKEQEKAVKSLTKEIVEGNDEN